MKQRRLIFAALAVLTAAGLAETTSYAETGGMERREDRRETREDGREEKAACKAGDEKSEPERPEGS